MDDRKCFSVNDVMQAMEGCDLRVWQESQASPWDRVRTKLHARMPPQNLDTARYSVNEAYDLLNDCLVALRDKTAGQLDSSVTEMLACWTAASGEEGSLF